ncbi:MAG: hypothetical protein JWO78_2376 [Micavibrio sp.]|nr:hypothetical protein [Micavibrio sp.]
MSKPVKDNNKDTGMTLSRDPSQALNEMMLTIDALRQVYVAETTALKASDTKTFLSLQDSKIEAAQKYHDGFTEFMLRKDEIMKAHPDLRKLFGRKQVEFSKIAADNIEALGRMNRITDRLGQRIMRAARENAAREGVAYGSGGNMNTQKNRPVTMGLNESA